jgi:hypothetical protein
MPEYATGPGHEVRSWGAVVETYVDSDALDFECPNCHAEVGKFCRHGLGHERKMPCMARMAAAKGFLLSDGDVK